MTNLREELQAAAKYCRDVPENSVRMELVLHYDGICVHAYNVKTNEGGTRAVPWADIENSRLMPILHTMHNGVR